MSLLNDYIKKGLGPTELQEELQKLMTKYNEVRNSYLFIYAAATDKPIPDTKLGQADYYCITDLLADSNVKNIDVYIETRGGSGETAEEVVRFLRKKFDSVSFVVSGEAKSAGTIIVLSGDEILMTETGSLGPIDAQIQIGRSIVSAYNYKQWVEEKREEAEKMGILNPFDAKMIAQITPGELGSAFHALKFAEDMVKEWLVKYKFRQWTLTETSGHKVTEEMKQQRAQEIAEDLTNHSKWRSHGRSIKIDDLEDIGLKITRVDDNEKLADIVYRIQTVIRLLFNNTSLYKIFATKDNKILRQAVRAEPQIKQLSKNIPHVVKIKQKCPDCNEVFNIYAKLVPDPRINQEMMKKGFNPFPKDAKIRCKCGYEIDLLGIKNNIEMQTGRKIVL